MDKNEVINRTRQIEECDDVGELLDIAKKYKDDINYYRVSHVLQMRHEQEELKTLKTLRRMAREKAKKLNCDVSVGECAKAFVLMAKAILDEKTYQGIVARSKNRDVVDAIAEMYIKWKRNSSISTAE